VAVSALALVIPVGLAVGLGMVTEAAGQTTRAGAAQADQATQYPRGLPPGDERFYFLGSETCRDCHRDIYIRWQASQHALSGADLSFEQQLDPNCRPCHLPGSDAFEEVVGCEACHGSGSGYAELDVMIDPLKNRAAGLLEPTEMCVYCHNPGHPFHVERDLEAAARRIHRP